MNLKEIQEQAEKIHQRYRSALGVPVKPTVALLVANLAARMQEQVEAPVYAFECDALKLVKQEADARARDAEEKALVPEAFEQMKRHCVTVDYQATVDMNDAIRDAVMKVHPFTHDGVLDYMRITSDRDGV